MVGTYGTSLEVDIGGGIELGYHDVDVVASHACAESRKAVAVVASCEGMQFAVLAFELNGVEDVLEHVHAVGVSNQEDVVGQVFAFHTYMVEAPIGSQYQFARFECVIHIFIGCCDRCCYG